MGHGCCDCSKADDCCPEEPKVEATEGEEDEKKETKTTKKEDGE